MSQPTVHGILAALWRDTGLDDAALERIELTGDELFRIWRPAGYVPIVRTNRDVPRDLFAHAIIHEYIHARLLHHAART